MATMISAYPPHMYHQQMYHQQMYNYPILPSIYFQQPVQNNYYIPQQQQQPPQWQQQQQQQPQRQKQQITSVQYVDSAPSSRPRREPRMYCQHLNQSIDKFDIDYQHLIEKLFDEQLFKKQTVMLWFNNNDQQQNHEVKVE
jgi:hypothetical protein